MAYIIIFPDTDWRHRCRHRGGDPDCDCYPECPECGAQYTPSDGHDCIDSELSKGDLLDIARELRDALDACETERDRLSAELDAAHDGEDALRSEVARLRAQVAALQAEDRRVGPDEVVVPRSATEYAVRAFDWIDCPDPEHYEALRSFHDALRTSAQAHNGEESK